MRNGPASRTRRAVLRAGAAVVLLLAVLTHLAVCGHDPVSLPRAGGPVAAAATSGAPGSVPDPHCCGGDEPTLQAPRGTAGPVPAGHEATTLAGPAHVPAGTSSGPGRASDRRAEVRSTGPSPARLGVWRT
ncbi:hypothetical protein [Streptomyces sp. NPDC127190]|uniref:hypothetical protein n=1 Tax=unclassified Streptomyces TaxID=2593676 RepID=UPI0036291501